MKKLILFALTLVLASVMCACSSQNDTQETQQTQASQTQESTGSQLHTIAKPKDDNSIEWGQVNGEVTITDKGGSIVLTKEDISGFAIVGTDDADSHYEMVLSDAGKALMNSANIDSFSLFVDDEKICDFTYKENENGTFSLGEELSYKELCENATKIRGLN